MLHPDKEADMMDAPDLDRLTRETRRQEFVDGLNDLQTGLFFILVGGLGAFLLSTAGMTFYIKALIWNRELTILGLLGVLGLLGLIAFGVRRVVGYLRGQVLWKGQGQATPLRVQVRWPAAAAATGIVVILILAGLILMPTEPLGLAGSMRVLAAASGIGTGILYVAMGRELDVRRLQWAGLAGGLLSACILLMPLDAAGSWLALGAAWMITLFVSGGLALGRRLAQVRPEHG
jgi:hypothetical protein